MDLKEYLVQEKLTIPALAKRCQVSENTLHRILRGDTPRYATALYISKCTAGAVSVNELIGDVYVLRRARKAGNKLLCAHCGDHSSIVLEDRHGKRKMISTLGMECDELDEEERNAS